MKNLLTAAALAVALATSATPAAALDGKGWTLSAGIFDTARDERPVEVGIEYRFPKITLFSLPITMVGGVMATENESFYVYGAFRYDHALAERWVLTPTLGAGIYEQGDGKDLGGPVEFRSGLEIAYRLANGQRVGLFFYHLSHANIYADNPGSNSLVFTWSLGR